MFTFQNTKKRNTINEGIVYIIPTKLRNKQIQTHTIIDKTIMAPRINFLVNTKKPQL